MGGPVDLRGRAAVSELDQSDDGVDSSRATEEEEGDEYNPIRDAGHPEPQTRVMECSTSKMSKYAVQSTT
jgi:hypothetical protein